MTRFYLVPKVGSGTFSDPIRAKYIGGFDGIVGSYTSMDYGAEAIVLVAATVTDAEHLRIESNPDVVSIPQDIDAKVSALAIETLRLQFESANLPVGWLKNTHTYRDLLKASIGLIQVMQRFQSHFGKLFSDDVTLDQRVSALGAGTRAGIDATAQSFGMDASGIKGTTPVRDALKLLADQIPPTVFGGQTF